MQVTEPRDRALDAALAQCWRLVAHAHTVALALEGLGDIELPEPARSASDVAFVESAAALYLAAELEAARLLPAVETLASISISGGLRADLGAAAALLYRFWQRRNERFAAAERSAFFARLFGRETPAPLAGADGSNDAFEPLMIDLAEAIFQMEPMLARPTAQMQVRLRLAVTRLAASLTSRSGGIASFAARDLLRSIQEAIDILKETPLQRALGANSAWSALEAINRLYLHEQVDVDAHVRRAKSGAVLLGWVAASLGRVDDPSPIIAGGDPVVGAASEWLEASLAIEESRTSYTATSSPPIR
jgi:hypothetical protein